MKRRLFISYLIFSMISIFLYGNTAFANKSSVRIEAPDIAVIGQEITIKLLVEHEGNNFLHYTDWVYVKINGKEIKRWTFSNFSNPESENFIREIRYTVTEPIEISAESDCNIHGTTGISQKTVKLQ